MAAVLASLLAALTARPVDAERWADAVDRWRYTDTARPADPPAEAWAAVLRAFLCRRGVEQMRADADEAARKCAELNIVTPVAALLQGIARVLSGDLDGGDAAFQDVMNIGEEAVLLRISRSRYASGRCWRWHAATGAVPRSTPIRPAPSCIEPSARRAS